MRVIVAVFVDLFFIGEFDGRNALRGIDGVERRIFSGIDDFRCPGLHAQAVVHEELRLTESLNGLRRRLKFMRFRSIGNEGVNIDFIAADGLGKFF